ncbi:PREDICTED: protein EFR3 homolog cmp44E-like [Erythranthe guttata]|nr:PREDICTED: protein EFR3 homolog cmp44E-like [Erythranthe guttata]|eukprot:XP_012828031.1 PREDICTED: protein EFR3 homolog cmp44E-like [Erythranthe guttata]
MSVVSGVISRQVLPACGSLCFFCPSMRARSRQPVKRYKKLISDIFPRSQEEEPNDRKIGKLCEYAAKNPLRIPKIAESLEQRCYKELRNENIRSVKIVMCIYRKLLVSCREQMPLFANSVMTIMQTLLDQANQDEMLIIGCESLFEFVNNQVGVFHMQFTNYLLFPIHQIVSVVLENYCGQSKESDGPTQSRWVQEVHKTEGHISPSPDVALKVPSWKMIVNDKGQLNVADEDSKNPCFWSRVCLHNMAKLGREATTMRRVLESLFRYFDNGNLWPIKDGIAFPVLKDIQLLMDDSGENTHLLLSILVKHLDHKNVLKQPEMQLDIVQVATALARLTNVQSSVAVVGAVSDVMRHLRKSIHSSLDDANLGQDLIKWNKKFREAVDECLVELSSKVGDAGLILDVMASMLENIPSVTVIARTTVSTVYRTAQIIASLPNLSYRKKAFPEALFHQLLPAMLHPDYETRIGAHQIFSVVLVPTSVSPQSDSSFSDDSKKKIDFPRTLSRTVSVFSSSAALFEKLRNQRNNLVELNKQKASDENNNNNNNTSGVMNRIKSTYSRAYSIRNSPAPDAAADSLAKSNKEANAVPLRLSSHQITFLFSSIWAQSISPANMPENYVAIAHTYSLVLLFSRAKNSYRDALIRSFQLAFSLRSVSLAAGGKLPPSRKRSLFILSTCMIIFSSKAYNILPLVPLVKATLSNKMVDPFMCLVADSKLQITETGHPKINYGSKEDNCSAVSMFVGDDDSFPDSVGNSQHNSQLTIENPNFLSVDQLLQSVLETAHNVGRMSVSTAPDASYKEMANHCETLLMGKQQKMSYLVNAQNRQGNLLTVSSIEVNNKQMVSHDNSSHKSGNSFADQKVHGVAIRQASNTGLPCAAEVQNYPSSFRLPSSSPYDNFLKAAGC